MDLLKTVATDGAAVALAQIAIDDTDVANLANERAEAWAANRAAEMVGKRVVDGVVIDNPNPVWRIDEGTRELLRGFVGEALDGGWSNSELASQIVEAFAFSEARAETIARTELAFADVAGNMVAYRASNVVAGKRWLLSNDDGCCDDCEGNAAQGVIDLEEDFESGDDAPPAHPNCRCDVAPVIADEED